MEFCPNCQTPRKPGSIFCDHCGHKFDEKRCPRCNEVVDPQAVYCDHCGCKLQEEATDITAESPVGPPPTPLPEVEIRPPEQVIKGQMLNSNNQYQQNIPKKSSKGALIVIIIVVAVVIVAAGAVFMFLRNRPGKSDVPAETKPPQVEETFKAAEPKYSYEVPEIIRPALYQSTEYIVLFKGSCEEEKEVFITVEIPGFTQKYEQKILLKPQEIKMRIRPPMIEGVINTLNTSKEAQIKVTLQDVATQKYLIQDTKPITLMSKYDMKWAKEDGTETYYQNICAWVTPEAPEIKDLLRNSINTLSNWSGGAISAVVGYQEIGGLNYYDVTYYQVAAIFETLRSYYKVRYNATPVSTSGEEAQQRIALPKDVIKQKSGLCIETAVTMASAIEATGMHPMILILPGHAQVAVEDWSGSGEYYLIETTALTEPDWNNIIIYLDRNQWSDYLDRNQVIVIDVELARKDGIKPME